MRDKEKIRKSRVNNQRNSNFFSIKKLMDDNRYELALEEIQKYYLNSNNSNDYDNRLLYGRILFHLEKYEQALEQFFIAYNYSSRKKYLAATEIGKCYYQLRNINYAEAFFYKALENKCHYEYYALYRILEIKLMRKEFKEFKELSKIIKPNDILNQLEKVKYLFLTNETVEATKLYNEMKAQVLNIKTEGNLILINGMCFVKTMLLREIGDIEKIYIKGEQYIAITEKDINRIHNEIVLQSKEKTTKEFLEKCEYLLTLDESFFEEVCLYKGMYYLEHKNYKLALDNYYIAINCKKLKIARKAYHFYALLLYLNGNYKEAEKNFLLSIEKNSSEKKYLDAYFYLIFIYIRTFNFNKAKYYLDEVNRLYNVSNNLNNSNTIGEIDQYEREYYNCLSFINVKGVKNYNPRTYIERQIKEYSNEQAIRHIYDHHGYGQPNSFDSKIDILELFYKTQEYLTQDNLCYCDSEDIYMVLFSDVGIYNDKFRYYRVVVLPGTKHIITMYPCNDINFKMQDVRKQLNEGKQNKIERFNKRFNLG